MVMETGNLSLRDAAARLGIAPLTLRRMAVYRRRLPYLKVGRRILFRPRDLDAFEQSCLVTGRASVNLDGQPKLRLFISHVRRSPGETR